MKKFKLLPIALILVLVAVSLVPATVLAAALTDCSVSLTDQTPSANATYTINFKTTTLLTGCTAGTFSRFNLEIRGEPVLPPSSGNYTLKVDGTPQTWESGDGPPSGSGKYTVTVDDGNDIVKIRYRHNSDLHGGTAITVEIKGVTNGSQTGQSPILMGTRDQSDPGTDVDKGAAPYILRQPGELVCAVTGELVSVRVNPGHVDYGVLAINADQNTAQHNADNNTNGMATPQTQEIHNNGTLPVDLEIMSSDAMHMSWGTQDWFLSGAKGLEQYTHSCNISSSVYDGSGLITFINMTGLYEYIDHGVPIGPPGVRYLELEIGMPNPTVDYNTHQITVIIRATASPPLPVPQPPPPPPPPEPQP